MASRVRYVGSPEHKDTPSFAGAPRPRLADASVCDPALADRQADITRWLQEAIRRGHTGPWEGDFPKYVWTRQQDSVYIGRLVNRGNGEYKGYELERHEWPKGI